MTLLHQRIQPALGVLFIVALVLVEPLRADIHVWTGNGVGKLWSNPANWQAPAGAPIVGEANIFLAFPGGVPAAALRSTNDIANLTVDTFALNGDNYHLAGTGGGTTLQVGLGFLGLGSGNQIETSLSLVTSDGIIFNLDIGADLTIQSVISGPGGLWQSGEGSTVTLSGSSANTYGGLTRVDGGLLLLQNGFLFGTVAVPGQLIVGNTNGNYGSVRLLADDQIADTSSVTINGDSYLYLNGHDDTIGSLEMTGGTIYTDGGLLSLNGDVTYHHWPLLDGGIAGRLGLGIVSRAFDIVGGTFNVTANIESAGTAGIIKNGIGLLGLWGTNTYSGHTTINNGQVVLHHNSALGAPGTGAQGTTVNPGGQLSLLNGISITGELLQLNSTGFLGLTGGLLGAGTCAWNGNVFLLGDSSVWAEGGGFLTINGVISGAYSFRKIGAGILRLSGSAANTYTGGTFVDSGLLQLSKTAGVNAVPGALTIGDDFDGADADIVRLLADAQLPDDAPITINSSGLLDLNASTDIVGPIIFNGGHLDSGNPTTSVWLGGDVTVNANANAQAIIDGGIFFYGNTNRIFNTVGHYFSPDLRVNGFISGQATAALVKSGVGEMGIYHTNNPYLGLTVVQQGSLQFNPGSEPGSTASGTVVSNGAFLGLFSGTHIGDEPLTLHGNSTNATAFTLFAGFGSNSWSGPITLAGDSAVNVFFTNDVLNLAGLISGPGGMRKIGPGTLQFSGGASNSFGGGMFVDAGRLVLAHSNDQVAVPGPLTIGDGLGGANADEVRYTKDFKQISRAAHVHINASGLLNLGGYPDSIGSLTGNGAVNLGPGGGHLSFGWDNSSFVFDGTISGVGTFSKYGAGTATLTGTSPATGFALVQEGKLLVHGSLVNSDANVYNGATLGGSGQVKSIVAHIKGIVSPGASPGQLNASQGVTFEPGSIYGVELNGLGAGSTYDQVALNGVLNLTNATLLVTVGFNSAPNDSFLLINNYGAAAANGAFAGLPQNALVTVNGAKYRISYTGASGNDVTLTHINTGPLLTLLNASPLKAEGAAVDLNGSINEPDAGDTVRLIVNWGDGTGLQTNSFPGSTTQFNISHTYPDDNPTGSPQDNYNINAFLQDAAGAISPTLNAATTISNVAPVLNLGGSVGVASGELFTNSFGFSDPGADTWSAFVDYGDGGGNVSVPVNANKTISLSHLYPSNGVYTVTLLVRDDDLGQDQKSTSVVVGLKLNIAPTATNHVALTWPTIYAGMTLQCATNLPAANWSAVANPPGIVSNRWIITLPTTNSMKYFRLYKP